MLTRSLLDELRTPAGQALIEAAASYLDEPLRGIEARRRKVPAELAAAAFEQARLRRRAAGSGRLHRSGAPNGRGGDAT